MAVGDSLPNWSYIVRVAGCCTTDGGPTRPDAVRYLKGHAHTHTGLTWGGDNYSTVPIQTVSLQDPTIRKGPEQSPVACAAHSHRHLDNSRGQKPTQASRRPDILSCQRALQIPCICLSVPEHVRYPTRPGPIGTACPSKEHEGG